MARPNKASPRGKSKKTRPGKRLRTGIVYSDDALEFVSPKHRRAFESQTPDTGLPLVVDVLDEAS